MSAVVSPDPARSRVADTEPRAPRRPPKPRRLEQQRDEGTTAKNLPISAAIPNHAPTYAGAWRQESRDRTQAKINPRGPTTLPHTLAPNHPKERRALPGPKKMNSAKATQKTLLLQKSCSKKVCSTKRCSTKSLLLQKTAPQNVCSERCCPMQKKVPERSAPKTLCSKKAAPNNAPPKRLCSKNGLLQTRSVQRPHRVGCRGALEAEPLHPSQ